MSEREGLRARGVSHAYGDHPVLHDVTLDVAPGRVTGLVGPNGSGKTTLLRCLYGSLRPTSGEVTLGGVPLHLLARRDVAREIAVVVQEDSGDTALTVAELVLLGRLPHRSTLASTTAQDRRVALAALRQVGAEHLARRPLTELSGGERQRVMVARALTQQAPYLLLDEPTNHLDVHYQHEVLRLTRLGTTTVVVLHDLNLAARYCDELAVLHQGRVVAHGTPREVLTPTLVEQVYDVRAAVVADPFPLPHQQDPFQLVLAPVRPTDAHPQEES